MTDDTRTHVPGAEPPPDPSFPPGCPEPIPLPRNLKHYKVIRELGSGGMGRVLKCLDTTLNRYVALKMLRPDLAREAGFLERFRREALAVAKTRHPNIVQIHSIDSDADTVFYIMEYIEGEGLDRFLERKGRMGEREAVQALRQAADGLCHVHRAGILHRDLKPSNLLVDPAGRIVLTDFGLAKMEFQRISRIGPASPGRPRSPAETDPDRVIGTPYYIAPECLSGREPDVRSDLYSLGVVFYEMLTGKVPFGGESPTAIFRGHLYEIPVPIGELAPEISLRVANIAYRCIEKNPTARYQTCEELLADLDAVVAEWSRDRDTQRRQQQAVELALTLGLEKKRPPSRGLGRIVALVMVLASLVALLLVALTAFRAFPPAGLPPGSHAGDREWAPGGSARVFGTLEAVDDGGDSPRVFLTLRRVRVSGAPAVRAALPRDAWERLGDKARPRPGDALFCQGRVAEAGGALELQVPGFGSVRAPGAPKTGVMQEGRFLSFPPATLADLPARTRVRVYGWVLARSDLGAGGSALLLGDGRSPDFEVRISPDPLVRSLDVRVGDYVETEGESAGVEGPRVVVENGVLLNVEAFGSPGAAAEPR